jgi:hypothetical protein
MVHSWFNPVTPSYNKYQLFRRTQQRLSQASEIRIRPSLEKQFLKPLLRRLCRLGIPSIEQTHHL